MGLELTFERKYGIIIVWRAVAGGTHAPPLNRYRLPNLFREAELLHEKDARGTILGKG